MADVIELDDFRPHALVVCGDETNTVCHVLPCSLLQDVAEGKQPLMNLPEEVLRRIVEEWLEWKAGANGN